MIDPPCVNPQHRVQPKRWAYRCAVLVAVLLMLAVVAALAWVVFVYAMLLRYKMMPPAGTSPLILLGLQWWPLNPPGGVCPGSASAYRLDEAWVGSSGTARRVKVPPSRAPACCPGRLGRTASGLGCSTHSEGAP